MDKILHYLKDPKLWELWYIPYYGSCRILSINRRCSRLVGVELQVWIFSGLKDERRRAAWCSRLTTQVGDFLKD